MSIILLISLVAFLDVAMLNWFLPYVTPKSIQFGVRIPRERESDPIIYSVRQSFHSMFLIGTFIIFLALDVAPAFLGYFSITVFSILAEIVFAHLVYFIAFRRLHRLKVRQGWYDGISEKITVLYSDDSPLRRSLIGMYFMFPALMFLAVAIFIGVTSYPHLPSSIPAKFHLDGIPYHFAPKDFLSAFEPTVQQAIITTALFGIGFIPTRTRQEIDVSRPYTTFEQQTRFKWLYRDILYVFASLIGVTFLLISLRIWYYPSIEFSLYSIVLPMIFGYVLLITAPYLIGQMGSRITVPGEELEDSGSNNIDDDREWRAGMFDFNKQDPSLLVGKRFGIGWTLNFANPRAWLILAAVAIMGVVIAFLFFLR